MLINPKLADNDKGRYNDYPLGLMYLSAALARNNYNVIIYDLNYQNIDNMYKTILEKKIKFIGITTCSSVIDDVLLISQTIKLLSPKSFIVLGGHHVNNAYKEIMESFIQIDYIIVGEGEYSICKLADIIRDDKFEEIKKVEGIVYRDNNDNIICINNPGIRDISLLSIPDWSRVISPIEHAKYYKKNDVLGMVLLARGCPFNCSFCSIKIDSQKRWKCNNVESVLNEILYLIQQYKVNYISYSDGDFLISIKKAMYIIKEANKYGIKKFCFSTRVDRLLANKQYIEKILKYGCDSIELGIESGSQTQLNRYGKNTTVEMNQEAINLLKELQKKYDFYVNLDMIIFDPFTTMNEIIDSFKFLKINNFNNCKYDSCLLNIMRLNPGTKMSELTYNEKLALKSHKLPHYKFINDDVALFYSMIKRFEIFIFEDLNNLRATITNKIVSNKNEKESLKYIKTIASLNCIFFEYFEDLINNGPAMYDEIYCKYLSKINYYKELIINDK